jgi:amidophosphoribosyltransferase
MVAKDLHKMFHTVSPRAAFKNLQEYTVGSWCLGLVFDDGEIFAARDAKGFRPLCVGKKGSIRMFASESAAFSAIGGQLLRDVLPGELVSIDRNGIRCRQFYKQDYQPAHCAFEFVYFAHPSSRIEGSNVYMARKRIGQVLARKYPIDADVVIPVPDSARPAALGYAQELKLPFEEGLIKDRYGRRSFIEPNQEDRVKINKRIMAIPEIVRDRHVVLVDDSLVRGTSSREIIKVLRKAGAKTISMLITFPPIRFPCYAGIDFPSTEELATSIDNESDLDTIVDKVREDIGADAICYNDMETLSLAIGIPINSLCFSCVNGDYSKLGLTLEKLAKDEG